MDLTEAEDIKTGGPLLPLPMVLGWGHLDGDEKEQRGDIPPTHIMRTQICGRVEERAVGTWRPRSLSPAAACLDLGNLTAAKPGSQRCSGGGQGGSSGLRATLGACLALPRLLQPSSLPWPPSPLRSGIASLFLRARKVPVTQSRSLHFSLCHIALHIASVFFAFSVSFFKIHGFIFTKLVYAMILKIK